MAKRKSGCVTLLGGTFLESYYVKTNSWEGAQHLRTAVETAKAGKAVEKIRRVRAICPARESAREMTLDQWQVQYAQLRHRVAETG
jgi:hypothetical protein